MDVRIKSLLAQLTLEEKASLCSGQDFWTTQPIPRLQVPEIWMADGPHGLRRSPSREGSGLGTSLPATCFPTASALASSWNVDLVKEVGQAIGKEAQAQEVQVVLGPGVNIKRGPLGGRNFEYYSEDPILSGYLATAFIQGVQSQGVGTSLKHFAVNNQEFQRMAIDAVVDERALREIYLRGFEIAVRQSQPTTIMTAYNKVNGTYCTEHSRLLQKILKDEWDYKGILISDWGANNDRVAGIKAGMHVEMPGSGGATDQEIVNAVRNGELEESRLDAMVAEILQIVFELNESRKSNVTFEADAHHELAKKAASESIILLQNEEQILPLTPSQKVAIIGSFAKEPRFQGAGSSLVMATQIDAAWDHMKALAGEDMLSYSSGYSAFDQIDESLIEEAVDKAKDADVAVLFIGLPPKYESEGFDRDHMELPPQHNRLVEAVSQVQPQTVVVLTNGSAVTMPWADRVKGIIEGWLSGQASGAAIADILYGVVNPSGKLSETFPFKLADTPAFINWPGEQRKVHYGEGQFVGYRYYDMKEMVPRFAFGHGLSYTTFEYSDLTISGNDLLEGIHVSCRVINTGTHAGQETIQLYVSDRASSLQRPVQELKAFDKIHLEAGEWKEVTFELYADDLAYYDAWRKMWITASGEFEFRIGASSRDIRLASTVSLLGTSHIPAMLDEFSAVKEALAYPLGETNLRPFMERFKSQRSPDDTSEKTQDELDGEEMMIVFMRDMPLIKFSAFTSGAFSHEDMYELIKSLN